MTLAFKFSQSSCVNAGILEQLGDALGGGLPFLGRVLVEIGAGGIFRVLETLEGLFALGGDEIGRADGVIGHRIEVDIGEIDAFVRAVINALAGEIAMQVHLAKADGVAFGIALGDGGDRGNIAHVRHGGQPANRGFDGLAEVG
jgi:hypothetical protein